MAVGASVINEGSDLLYEVPGYNRYQVFYRLAVQVTSGMVHPGELSALIYCEQS